jgi:hypothetical protein
MIDKNFMGRVGMFFSWVNDEENDSWHHFLKRS